MFTIVEILFALVSFGAALAIGKFVPGAWKWVAASVAVIAAAGLAWLPKDRDNFVLMILAVGGFIAGYFFPL